MYGDNTTSDSTVELVLQAEVPVKGLQPLCDFINGYLIDELSRFTFHSDKKYKYTPDYIRSRGHIRDGKRMVKQL